MIWLLTCEHYSIGVPLQYAHLFTKAVDVLESHRGYDVRVAPMYLRLEPLFDEARFFRYSRLLIEPNRQIQDKHLFSPFTAQLSTSEKADITSKYYHPYRTGIERFIEQYIDEGVFHISVHSFHPGLGSQTRETPIGISFDSKRQGEREVAMIWRRALQVLSPSHSVRFNYPYRGSQNGFTTYLRNCFPEQYTALELEVRNDVILDMRQTIYESLANLRGVMG